MKDTSAFPHKREIDVDALMETSVESRFRANASLEEGVSGQLGFDAQYEQGVADEEILPLVSSDKTRYESTPAPHDVIAHKFPWRRS